MANIHPTAIIADNAELAEDVEVGPYSIVHDNAHIGAGTVIGAHSIIHSYVSIGEGNLITDHVVLGGAPQDISYQGQETWLRIGNENTIREYCSIHRSNNHEEDTTMGSGCYMMCNSHAGHNCHIGNNVIITAFVGLSGHIEVGDNAVLGGSVGVHQFCRIGAYAMVAGFTPVTKDVLPYCLLGRDPVAHYKLNSVGLRRAGIKGERYKALEQRIRQIRSGDTNDLDVDTDEIKLLNAWIDAPSKRGIYKFI